MAAASEVALGKGYLVVIDRLCLREQTNCTDLELRKAISNILGADLLLNCKPKSASALWSSLVGPSAAPSVPQRETADPGSSALPCDENSRPHASEAPCQQGASTSLQRCSLDDLKSRLQALEKSTLVTEDSGAPSIPRAPLEPVLVQQVPVARLTHCQGCVSCCLQVPGRALRTCSPKQPSLSHTP